VDTTHGTVALTARASTGGLQKGIFNGGAFIVTQERTGETDLALTGGRPRSVCQIPSGMSASAAAAQPPVLRTLHATAHGRFRTTGQYASATIRGTEWTTTDTCAATTIADERDRVLTRANIEPITFPLMPGETISYHCSKVGLPPVSRGYCIEVIGEIGPETTMKGVTKVVPSFAMGLATLGPARRLAVCIRPPSAAAGGCTPYPLGPPNGQGLRFSTVICQPDRGPGPYVVTVRLGGVQLGPRLTYHAPNRPVIHRPCETTFGQSGFPAQVAPLSANIKRVNEYSVPTAASVPYFGMTLQPTGVGGAEQVRGVIYADRRGAPGRLVGATLPITIGARTPPKRYFVPVPSLHRMRPGRYWIGVLTGGDSGVAAIRYLPVAGSAPTNANAFSAGPSDPFGSITSVADTQMALYVDYLVGS
jgi:hypothetical protein